MTKIAEFISTRGFVHAAKVLLLPNTDILDEIFYGVQMDLSLQILPCISVEIYINNFVI